MLKAIMFDFDGTLVRSNDIKFDAFLKTAEHFGETRDKIVKILEDNQESDRYDIFHLLSEGNLKKKNKMLAYFSEACEKLIITCEEVDYALETLKDLNKKNYLCFINSRTPDATLKNIIKAKCWEPYFQDILGAKQSKEENFKAIRDKYDLSIEEVLFVGDGIDDVRCAHTQGLSFFLMRNNSNLGLHEGLFQELNDSFQNFHNLTGI